MKKQIIELVDDIIHNVSVGEMEKAKLLLETLKVVVSIKE